MRAEFIDQLRQALAAYEPIGVENVVIEREFNRDWGYSDDGFIRFARVISDEVTVTLKVRARKRVVAIDERHERNVTPETKRIT